MPRCGPTNRLAVGEPIAKRWVAPAVITAVREDRRLVPAPRRVRGAGRAVPAEAR
jgi:hypothetical protein